MPYEWRRANSNWLWNMTQFEASTCSPRVLRRSEGLLGRLRPINLRRGGLCALRLPQCTAKFRTVQGDGPALCRSMYTDAFLCLISVEAWPLTMSNPSSFQSNPIIATTLWRPTPTFRLAVRCVVQSSWRGGTLPHVVRARRTRLRGGGARSPSGVCPRPHFHKPCHRSLASSLVWHAS